MGLLLELVTVKTGTGTIAGQLYGGKDGLPELLVDCGCPEFYRPATFPHAWELRPASPMAGVLLQSWWDVEGVRARIVHAEREAEETHADVA